MNLRLRTLAILVTIASTACSYSLAQPTWADDGHNCKTVHGVPPAISWTPS